MSSLFVEVCKIKEIKKHSNADRLEIAKIKGWDSIVPKGQYNVGDTVIFIPPDSMIPTKKAIELGINDYLAGTKTALKRRVKQVKLRGEMSYGIVIPNKDNLPLGTDVSEQLGITKYQPPIRMNSGDAAPDDVFFPKMSSIENIRNVPDTFKEGQTVAITEKLDGTQSRLGCSEVILDIEKAEKGEYDNIELYELFEDKDEVIHYATWKAGSNNVNRKRPKTFEEMRENAYWFPYTLDSVYNLIEYLILKEKKQSVQLFGEVYGGGISGGHKSLNYGQVWEYGYAAFGLKIDGKRLGYSSFKELCDKFDVPTVPLIAVIRYDFDKVVELSRGDSILAKKNSYKHIREGVVACTYDDNDEWAVAKFLNPDYLLLKEKGRIKDFKDE